MTEAAKPEDMVLSAAMLGWPEEGADALTVENRPLHSEPLGCERDGDLDEVAGATDAIACSRRGFFRNYKTPALSDSRLRCASTSARNHPASGTPEAIKWRNGD